MEIKSKENIRDLFIGLDEKVLNKDNKKIDCINFDNAATTPPLKSSIDYVTKLAGTYGSIGRGTGQKATITTELYHASKEFLLDFFKVRNKEKYVVIYVSNTTEAMNKLANTLPKEDEDEIVITTRMEHHSNDLPWRKRGKVDYIEVDDDGRLKTEEIEQKLIQHGGKVKYVSITGASNVTGYTNDIHKIAKTVHKYGAKIIMDAAQLVPHKEISIKGETEDEDIDFMAFSSHKIYSPFGIGVLIGLKEEFEKASADYVGGGTVDLVLDNDVYYLDPPERNEAGTPNFFGVMSLLNSLRFINTIGYDYIEAHEKILLDQIMSGLNSIPKIINYGDTINTDDRLGIATFNIKGLFHHDTAEILAKRYGISVRQGWFCSHTYCRRLMHMTEDEAKKFMTDPSVKMEGMVRLSFAIYNTVGEVDKFLNAVDEICRLDAKR